VLLGTLWEARLGGLVSSAWERVGRWRRADSLGIGPGRALWALDAQAWLAGAQGTRMPRCSERDGQ